MKFFTAAALFAAALFSVVVSVPFLPHAKEVPELFAVSVTLTTSSSGRLQVYYDTGGGFNETESSQRTLTPGPTSSTYALPLPLGTIHRLRLDPIDGSAPVLIEALRIIASSGEIIRELPLETVQPVFGIAAWRRAGAGFEMVPADQSNDPQLLVTLDPPVTLGVSLPSLVYPLLTRAAAVFIGLAILLLLAERAARHSRWKSFGRTLIEAAHRHPGRTLAATAAAAVIASSYPVVFLGKSYVSPNMGTTLLYDQFPTLPGYGDDSTGEVMGSDIGAIMWQHVPLSMVQRRAIAEGELPLWNRYNSAGTPLLGQGQSMFGDPIHLLVIAANGASWAWDLKYLVAKWLFAFALGLLAYEASRSGDERGRPSQRVAPAAVVALAAPFVGFFVYRFNHPAFFSFCYAPWTLYCWLRIANAARWRSSVGWALGLVLSNLALMNSGTAKEAYMLLVTMNFTGACVLLASGARWRVRLAKLALAAAAGVVLVLLTAPIWGTFLHELRNSYTSYNSASAYQIQPSLLLGAFDEIFYRPLMPAEQTFSPSLNFLLLGGFLYFLATLRAHFRNRIVIGIAAASLLPFALAFGVIPPQWLVRIPFVANIAHIDNTFSCALIVLWSVLAGVGFAAAAARLPTYKGKADLVIAGLLLVALVTGWVAFGHAVHRPIYGPAFTVNHLDKPLARAPFLWVYLLSLLLALGAAAAFLRGAMLQRKAGAATCLMLALCALVLCWRHGLHASAVGFERYVLRPTTRVDLHATSEAVAFLQAEQEQQPSRAVGLGSNLFPGWTAAYGIETTHGPDALMSPWYRELTAVLPGLQRIWDWRLYVEPKDLPSARRSFDALNVRYYVDRAGAPAAEPLGLRTVTRADLTIHESSTAWPRAFFTDRVLVYDDVAEFGHVVATGDGRPFAAVQRKDMRDHPPLAALWGKFEDRAILPGQDYHLTENDTTFQVNATGPGVVVLHEAWWPGDFRAYVNGRKVPIIRLNHAFKGVAVPGAGEYEIAFRYVPRGWYRNLILSAIGGLLLLSTLVGLWYANRRSRTRLDASGTAAVEQPHQQISG